MTVRTYRHWLDDYGPDVEAALAEAFEQAAILLDPNMPQVEAHRLAVEFAEVHATELLKLDGDLSMAAVTRDHVQALVADAIESGDSLRMLAQDIRDDVAFSKKRAILTARTETAIAHGQGSKAAAMLSGRDMKRWVTQGVGCDDCRDNEADGDIAIGESFTHGDTIPAHPNCMCNVRYFHGG